jgi:transposase-like protein
VKTYSESQPKLAAWAEENLPEGFAVFAFPEAHRKRLRTSNACASLEAGARSCGKKFRVGFGH